MLAVPLIVNHISDPNKVNGLITSTFSYLGSYQDAQGVEHVALININNVIWPDIASPLHHQETDADLSFVSVYDINADADKDDDEAELNSSIAERLEAEHPEIYDAILSGIEEGDDGEENDDAEEADEAIDAASISLAPTTTIVDNYDGAEAPNN